MDATSALPLFTAGAAASDVRVRDSLAGSTFTDAAQALVAGPGCVAGPPVACSANGVDARLSAHADRFRYHGSHLAKVTAGGGDDHVLASGDRNDVRGGAGGDDIWINGNGPSTAAGGSGKDRIYGTELPVNLAGGGDADLVYGDSGVFNRISGNDGDDTLVGGAGSPRSGGGTVSGSAGKDVIVVLGHDWTISGGRGNDLIRGGPDVETITAGDGADRVDVRDGVQDAVSCGAGVDVAYADPIDTVAADCETVSARPAPDLPALERALARAAKLKAAFGT
ncbi:MAG TPA: hypothetical protein VNT03_11405 [Baekduia sp.]|nr:hypothetical protein [Baekduia sp.]